MKDIKEVLTMFEAKVKVGEGEYFGAFCTGYYGALIRDIFETTTDERVKNLILHQLDVEL